MKLVKRLISFQEKGSTETKKKNLSYLTAYIKAFQLISEKMTILASAGLVNTDLPSPLNLISFYFLAKIHRNYLQW